MKKFIITFLLAFLIVPILKAQEKYQLPSDLRCETTITEPLNLRKGYFRTSFGFALAPYDKYFDRQSGTTRLLNHIENLRISGVSSYSNQYNLNFQYGVSNRFNIGVYFWYLFKEETFLFKAEAVAINELWIANRYSYERGFGDLDLDLTYQISQKKDFYSTINLSVKAPTGSLKTDESVSENKTIVRNPVGSNKWGMDLGISTKKVFFPFSIKVGTSISYSFGNEELKPSSTYILQSSFGTLLNSWFSVSNAWNYVYAPARVSKNIDLPDRSIYFLYTGIIIEQQVKRFRFSERLVFPLAGSQGASSNFNLIYVVSYTF